MLLNVRLVADDKGEKKKGDAEKIQGSRNAPGFGTLEPMQSQSPRRTKRNDVRRSPGGNSAAEGD